MALLCSPTPRSPLALRRSLHASWGKPSSLLPTSGLRLNSLHPGRVCLPGLVFMCFRVTPLAAGPAALSFSARGPLPSCCGIPSRFVGPLPLQWPRHPACKVEQRLPPAPFVHPPFSIFPPRFPAIRPLSSLSHLRQSLNPRAFRHSAFPLAPDLTPQPHPSMAADPDFCFLLFLHRLQPRLAQQPRLAELLRQLELRLANPLPLPPSGFFDRKPAVPQPTGLARARKPPGRRVAAGW
jgi:hypothetical protein